MTKTDKNIKKTVVIEVEFKPNQLILTNSSGDTLDLKGENCTDFFTRCESIEDKIYEPYFGWCDVEGCENEGCSGGNAWNETGFWTVCYKHSAMYRNGAPQPLMKQSAIDRENSRDKITGFLVNTNKND